MGSEDLMGLTVRMCTRGDRDKIRDSDKYVWELWPASLGGERMPPVSCRTLILPMGFTASLLLRTTWNLKMQAPGFIPDRPMRVSERWGVNAMQFKTGSH